MPLIKSHTDEARKQNIQEMIKAGNDPKQAVASGYANQRKYKKMAEGGLIEEEIQDLDPRTLGELHEDSNPEEMYESKMPEDHMALAKALKKDFDEEDED